MVQTKVIYKYISFDAEKSSVIRLIIDDSVKQIVLFFSLLVNFHLNTKFTCRVEASEEVSSHRRPVLERWALELSVVYYYLRFLLSLFLFLSFIFCFVSTCFVSVVHNFVGVSNKRSGMFLFKLWRSIFCDTTRTSGLFIVKLVKICLEQESLFFKPFFSEIRVSFK